MFFEMIMELFKRMGLGFIIIWAIGALVGLSGAALIIYILIKIALKL